MATTMIAGLGGGATVRRIRTPNPQDVLSGRGGGINSHEGNKVFREWVHQRKEDYNLAQNKKEKTEVAMEVVRQVQLQVPIPGRFLQKDPTVVGGNGGHWWVEIDEGKALAKTTQALREGAPKIRQAHQTHATDEVTASTSTKTAKKRKRKNSDASEDSTASVPEMETEAETSVADATETMTLKQNNVSSSLPRYASEQMLLPTTDYTVALERLQENVQKAKHEADIEQQHEIEIEKLQEQPQAPQQQQQQILPPQGQPQQQQPQSQPMIVAPLTSNKAFNERYRNTNGNGNSNGNSMKRSRFNPLTMPAVDPFADTPPLMATPEPDLADEIPVLSLDGRSSQSSAPAVPRKSKMRRVHSLALSDYDISNPDEVEFVNPFADESNVLASENDRNVVMSHVPQSVSNQWNGGNGNNNEIMKSSNSRSKFSGINEYLNRILSSESSASVSSASLSSDYEGPDPQSRIVQNDENNNNDQQNDYFLYNDDLPESDFGEGMKSIFDVVHPERDLTSPERGNDHDDNSSMRPTLLMPWRGGTGGSISNNSESDSNSNNKNNKSSSNSLIRRSSFSSRNRGSLSSGRQ